MTGTMTSSAPDPRQEGDTIDLIALWRMLWRRRVLVAIFAAATGAVAVVYALVSTPIYRAESVVTPLADSGFGDAASVLGRFGGLASLAGIDLGNRGVAAQEAHAVLQSRRLVEEFIRRNGLVDEILPPGGETSGLWHAVQRFRNTVVDVNMDEQDGTTTVSVEWKDPALAARWANGLVALANELMRAKAIADSTRNIAYLQKQIETTNVVEMQRVMYDLIENETKTLMLANARADFAFRVVDPAVTPEARVRPKRKLIVVTGVAVGLILGVLVAVGLDTLGRYRARESSRGAATPS